MITPRFPSTGDHFDLLHTGVQRSTVITGAVSLMTAAALGDRFGRRRTLAVSLGLFVAASAACALAPDVGTLIAARAGLGSTTVDVESSSGDIDLRLAQPPRQPSVRTTTGDMDLGYGS